MLRRTSVAAAAVALAVSGVVAATAQAATPRKPAQVRHLTQTPKKQPVVLGFYEGRTVRYFDFGPVKLKPGNTVEPIWTFTNGAAGQRNIIATVPGEKEYTPLWRVNEVTWAAGKTPRVLTSAAVVREALAAGELKIKRTATVVNGPVLGFGQERHAGFSAGHVIRYYDLGPVTVAPGNDVVPLYTVTNGVAAQHNVTGDTIAPGQTEYPPLWSIVKVTWKPGAARSVLKSYAAIQKAAAAGRVTLTKTSLVVNCPIV